MEEKPVTDAFLAQWDLDSIPACDEGMALLKTFAERSPTLYLRAAAVDFIDPAPLPYFGRNPHWRTFSHHWASCEKCNET